MNKVGSQDPLYIIHVHIFIITFSVPKQWHISALREDTGELQKLTGAQICQQHCHVLASNLTFLFDIFIRVTYLEIQYVSLTYDCVAG